MKLRSNKGAAAIEFAIILPFMVLLAIGICEFGLLCYNSQVIINASREGARAGIVRGSDFSNDAKIRSIVKNYCNPRLVDFNGTSLTDGDIILTPPSQTTRAAAAFGTDFKVEVTYNYSFLVPSLFNLGSTKTLRGRTLMKMEPEPS